MKKHIRSMCCVLLMLSVLAMMAGCSKPDTPDATPEQTQNRGTNPIIHHLTITDPTFDLSSLDTYTGLEIIEFQGYSDYEGILNCIAKYPNIEIRYDVAVGDQRIPHNAQSLEIDANSCDYDQLLQNLKYLPDVAALSLPETSLTATQMEELRQVYPNIQLTYSLRLGDTVYTDDAVEADASWLLPEQIPGFLDQITLLPGIETLNLMSAEGASNLSLTDVKLLQDALPQVFFQYSFDLFGKIVSTSDEVIEYDEVPIGNEGEERIRQALDILTNCTYFKLDDCGLSNEVMASIREDYPNVKVVWRVRIEPFSMLTDETMLRLTFHMNDGNVADLKYLNDVTYLDMGHNDTLTDISFIQYMPKLQCVILSGAPITDISYFAECKDLVWLELCFCSRVEDLSPLSELTNLKYLNVSHSMVSDLSPLKNVPLERLNCMNSRLTWETEDAFVKSHPDCLSVFKGKQPYGYGWRYNDYGYTFFEYYANMRIVFRYDDSTYYGNHKEK